jgi:hypothetical protein
MGFSFRRTARLGLLRFDCAWRSLSSISMGVPRTTVRLPDTGLSWSVEHPQARPGGRRVITAEHGALMAGQRNDL